MAIADTISSMYENVGEVYDTITNVDLPTNKNIENIPSTMRSSYLEIMNNGIDKIWNNWEKVTGEGETLTLNSTEEAPMKINLKGNTYQFTTTGKNKYNATRSGATTNTVTYSGDTSKIYINGTPNNTGRIFFNKTYLEAGTYTFSATLSKGSFTNGGNNLTYLYLYKGTETTASWDFDTRILLTAIIGNVVSATFTISEGSYYYLSWYLDTNYTWTNAEIKYQVESGSSFTSFEPYTNGASPNPNYPQDIHVVSGDNSINVCGKNILKLPDNIRTFNGGVNVETSNNTKFTFTGTSSAAYYNSFALNYHLPKGTYTMSSTNNNFKYYFWFRDKINVTTYANVHLNNSSRTFILEEDAETIIVGVEGLTSGTTYNIETYFQLEKGDSATSYEPFNSDTYNVSLPIKNLFDSSLFTNRTVQGITLTKNSDGTITLNGTSTARADFTIIDSFSLKGDNKIASIFKKGGTTTGNVTFGIYDSNWANGKQCNITSSSDIGNASLPSEITLTKCFIRIESGITLSNLTIALQIEQGTETNSYTPYGTTPIELCKIGDYQDSIKKSTGKNLFDNTYNDLGMWITNIGETTTFAQGSQYLGAYCKVEPGTYTISRNKKTNRFRIGISPNQPTGTTSSCYVVASNDNASSITIDVPQGNNYICIYLSNNSETSTNVDLMINEGTTALPYEPYGKAWYLNKQTGKITFNGSENWGRSGNTSESFFCGALAGVNIPFQAKMGTAVDSKCNYFAKGNSHSNAEVFDMYNGTDYYTAFALYLSTSRVTDVTTFKNWLASNNTTLYYVLYQPTYEKITGELLNQLEAIKNSYENQTNINQENNDLPFELDVTALKELTQ